MLTPLAAAYDFLGRARTAMTRAWRAPVPIVCVGNLVVGGAGKTPVAIDIGERLAARGFDAHFLSRGYGGALAGPVRVAPDRHGAAEVGDEPLLLAQTRPTWIARDRPAGARAAIATGAEVIVMDDGFQNPSLHKDLSFVVVDGRRGFGNGHVMPAGPLREPVQAGLARAQAVVILGEDTAGVAAEVASYPVLSARLVVNQPEPRLSDRPVVAFAGIADPDKFFRTVGDLGHPVVATFPFPDHHPYTNKDLMPILEQARPHQAVVLTTAKDFVRVPEDLRQWIEVLPVRLVWDNENALDTLLETIVVHGK